MSAKRLNLPDTASVAIESADGRLYAPSAKRNANAIRDVVSQFAPGAGRALEIASGTGEHVTELGRSFPAITWQPTDIDEVRLKSISSWQRVAGTPNVLPPALLDASLAGWSNHFSGQNLIIAINLLHLISVEEARTVIAEIAMSLSDGGVALIYGPFMRGTEFASQGDLVFHQSLVGQDPAIGYKSHQIVQEWQSEAGLVTLEPIEMPAQNLMLAARKPAES